MRMKRRPSPLECWSASTMLSPASARKPLTAAIRPGRSGQASSRRDVGRSVIAQLWRLAAGPVARLVAQDPVQHPSGARHFAPATVLIDTRYVKDVTEITQA